MPTRVALLTHLMTLTVQILAIQAIAAVIAAPAVPLPPTVHRPHLTATLTLAVAAKVAEMAAEVAARTGSGEVRVREAREVGDICR